MALTLGVTQQLERVDNAVRTADGQKTIREVAASPGGVLTLATPLTLLMCAARAVIVKWIFRARFRTVVHRCRLLPLACRGGSLPVSVCSVPGKLALTA